MARSNPTKPLVRAVTGVARTAITVRNAVRTSSPRPNPDAPEPVEDAELRDPLQPFGELIAAVIRGEAERDDGRNHQGDQRHQGAEPLAESRRKEGDEQGADQRYRPDRGQGHELALRRRIPPATTAPPTKTST